MHRQATTEALQALVAAHAAEIATLKAENETLAQRVSHLEEQLRLERLHRYAPRSEKLKERLFNEAEQAAAEGEETDDVKAALGGDEELADAAQPEPKKRGRRPLPEDLPRERIEHDLPDDQKLCPCCRNRMHRKQAEHEPDLREWDYGIYEGRTTKEIRGSVPGWSVWNSPIPEGESIDQIQARANSLIQRLLASNGRVALFSHSHFLRVFAGCWISGLAMFGAHLVLDTASISILGFDHENRAIRQWNVRHP